MKGTQEIIPSWRAFASTKTQSQILWRHQESFHQLQLTLDPDQGSQLNDSLVRFFLHSKDRKKMLLSEYFGVHANETPLYFFQEAMGQADSISFNIYSALMESGQKHYQLCLTARGFLKLSGPGMAPVPTNPLSLPRVWGDHVPVNMAFDELPPLWSHSHPNHVHLLGEEGKGGNRGTSESRKTNP